MFSNTAATRNIKTPWVIDPTTHNRLPIASSLTLDQSIVVPIHLSSLFFPLLTPPLFGLMISHVSSDFHTSAALCAQAELVTARSVLCDEAVPPGSGPWDCPKIPGTRIRPRDPRSGSGSA